MAKRFTSTEIWSEDWFLDMPNEYKIFWFYMLSNCSHSGLFKVNLRSFSRLNGVNIDHNIALIFFNEGKNRITALKDNFWYIEDFFVYQYGTSFNVNNRVHFSVKKELELVGIKVEEIRGLKGVNLALKDKDKDKDKDISLLIEKKENNEIPFVSPYANVERFVAPTLDEVKLKFAQLGRKEKTAISFFNYYEGLGWQKGNSKIFNWGAFANNWDDKQDEIKKPNGGMVY